jgi:uncharacterized protein
MIASTNYTLDDVIAMTLRDGEGWAVAHARRLLELIKLIGQDTPYDLDALTLAVYLHDWGAFPCYQVNGVEHALRSRQVAETEILPHMDLSLSAKQIVLEAVELHDYRDTRPTQSNEALLLREADMLEFLGVIGMARDFARGPRDVEICHRRILARKANIREKFTLPRAQEIAAIRIEHMEQCLQWLDEESFGVL